MTERFVDVTVGERSFRLSHPTKVLFPGDNITKADLVGYYRAIAPVMAPHLQGRPLMLQRFPDGIDGNSFFQKDIPDYFPEWIRTVKVAKEGGTVTQAICDDEAGLAYLAGQACITPHAWLSRADHLDRPDRLIFDLDPSGSGDTFPTVRSTAHELRDILRDLDLVAYVQTTGSRGLHVVTPLDASADFDDVREFARRVAAVAVNARPDQRTTEARKAKRGDRVFIDVLRNAYAQTAVAPYAIRALAGAPAATPLEWRELGDRRLHPRRYTAGNLSRRLARRDDPWSDMSAHARPLRHAQERLGPLRPEG